MKTVIATKQKMYDLYQRGLFGNKPLTWFSLFSCLNSGYTGEISARCVEVSNPTRLYHIPIENLVSTLATYNRDPNSLVYSEAPPDQKRTIQGEITINEFGLYLRYTTAPHPMRIAFDHEDLVATGLSAKLLLQKNLTPTDYDWLLELLHIYDGAIIEFSTFSIPVGVLKTNMLVWEVRHY